ncbi:wax ester/triacylglycerol synthase family O-acyltransferase [Herbaspirillum sp. HC18]|nr:wax ester/triacylglycerol synthase family O-acyltransferase [Herbaspirillum sp. HC18]
MPEREPLSIIDAAWLRMDRPTNLMMICGMLIFEERVDPDAFKEVVLTRMLCFHRFRQRVVERSGRPKWEDDRDFDIDWHVRQAVSTAAALPALLSELVSTPLNSEKPMWQFHLVDVDDGSSALILRVHHCYADGFALMHVLESMTDALPDRPRLPACDFNGAEDTRGAWERVLGPVTETIGDTIRAASYVVDAGISLMERPGLAVDYGKVGYAFVRDAAVIAAMTPDSPTRFKGDLSIAKRVAWAKPLSLFEVKAVGDAFGCSVNDVLLACVAGTLRNYLAEQGDEVDGIEMRALVPVNCRPPGRIRELGNKFGLVFLGLPLGIADPFERMMEVHRRMDELKLSQQPTIALGILAGMGSVPETLKESLLESLAANASAVITNVRGASSTQYLAGKRIARQVFWVPQSGGIGMGISILTYEGKVDFGVVTDTKRVPRPDMLVTRFTEEFDTLLLSALLMPWGAEQPPRSREHDNRLHVFPTTFERTSNGSQDNQTRPAGRQSPR